MLNVVMLSVFLLTVVAPSGLLRSTVGDEVKKRFLTLAPVLWSICHRLEVTNANHSCAIECKATQYSYGPLAVEVASNRSSLSLKIILQNTQTLHLFTKIYNKRCVDTMRTGL
jgi:hypothetical protein